MNRPPSLHRQVIAAAPRGFAAPLSHDAYFTEPLALASGLANAPDELRKASPGTFGSIQGRLRKAKSASSIRSQRWHSPSGQNKAARVDRLMAGTMARLLHPKPPAVKIRDLEHARSAANDERQRQRIRALCAN
jgi:hypothetical protein